jgi:hypothetical protein
VGGLEPRAGSRARMIRRLPRADAMFGTWA